MMWLLAVLAVASVAAPSYGLKLDNLVLFGDSYTDEGRLGYFINHKGSGPATGTVLPESNSTASGGKVWGRFVAEMTGAALFDYAVSGATCSNEIISRYFSPINAPFPSVIDYEIPAFKADTGVKTLYKDRQAENTVYALWIGTNDLGFGAFLSDSQAPGTTISSFVDCVWEVFDSIYATGGRHFVLLNEAPLERAPMYAAPTNGGSFDNQYWQNKTSYNMTEYQYKMLEYTTDVNTMFEYGVPFQVMIKKRWPGASFAIFDVHKLIMDIINTPSKYLSAPANVTGFYHHCVPTNNSQCVNSKEAASSFLWFDELHPSEYAGSYSTVYVQEAALN
jgi:phospholipase/lecithinase/hemolysin